MRCICILHNGEVLTDSNVALLELYEECSPGNSTEVLWTSCRNSWTSDSSEFPKDEPNQVDRQF